MKFTPRNRQRQQGFSLIEVLVTLVILMLGLLGLVGLMVTSQRSQMESYQRVQALVLVEDMANRINANRYVAPCYVVTTNTNGTPYLGTGSAGAPACALGTVDQQARAISDLNEWSSLLLGSAEAIAGNNAGAMVGARGCIEQISSGVYQVSVAWQGNGKTFAPAAGVACAMGLYGDETARRVITVPIKIAKLS